MKCLRCKHDMRRRKTDRGYEYHCPYCKLVIRGNTHTTNTADRESVADNSTTSRVSEE